MSKAADYAKAIRETEKKKPAPFTVDGGKLAASVADDGYLEIQRQMFDPKEAVLLGRWIMENYGTPTVADLDAERDTARGR